MIGGKNVFCMTLLEYFGILENFLINDWLYALKISKNGNFMGNELKNLPKLFNADLC